MLYKFKTKATGDVIMLQPNGQRVLEIIGKHTATDPSIKGILLPEQMAQALHALSEAIAQEETRQKQAITQAKLDKLPTPRFDAISLRQRALPLMEMIRTCQEAQEAITWGV